MQATAQITNPLNLPVEWRCPTPLHEVTDYAHMTELAEAMRRDGWNGAPVVADYSLREAGQDRAYTGSHRIAAWAEARGEHGVPVPCVWIEDIASEIGTDWGALLDECDGDPYEAAAQLCYRAPAGIAEAYGLDVGGA